MTGRKRWTDADDAVLRAGYEAARRVRDIAADLGMTKNMVIARANRLGLSGMIYRVRQSERTARCRGLGV